RSEGNDVMLHLALDFMDARDVEGGMGAQGFRSFLGNIADFGQSFGGGKLDLQPLGEAVFVREDLAHFRACVSGNQEDRIAESGPLSRRSIRWLAWGRQ